MSNLIDRDKLIDEANQEIKQGALFSNGSIEVHNKEDWDRFQADINRGNGNDN